MQQHTQSEREHTQSERAREGAPSVALGEQSAAHKRGTKQVIRASGLGRCIRSHWASGHGYGCLAVTDGAAATYGTRHELAIIAKATTLTGLSIDSSQREVRLRVSSSLVIVGHVDGVASDGRVVEVKTMSHARYRQWVNHGFAKFTAYAWQISAYMYALEAQALYVVQCREDEERGCCRHAKRARCAPLRITDIVEAPYTLEAVRYRAKRIHRAMQSADMPECDTPEADRYFCGHWYLHE